MRVKDCLGCEYCERLKWTHEHQPKNYHTIGMSHVYRSCLLAKDRLLNVKKCPKAEKEAGLE